MECTMIRKSQAASLLTLALVLGMSAPAQALATLPFDQVDEAPQAVITGSTATVANVTNLNSAGEANFDDVYEGWFACDTATSFGFTGPTIHSLLIENSTLVGFAFTPPTEVGTWNCRSLETTGSSVNLSSANVWDSTSSAFVSYSTRAASFPHIAYFGAYVTEGQVPATSNVRIVTPFTREYSPPAPDTLAPTASGALLASDGTTLTITFNEDMKAATAPSGFQVIKNAMSQTLTPGNISQAGRTLVLTLTSPMLQSDVLELWYAQPGNGVEDVAGNDLASFGGPNGSPVAITNNSSQTGQVQGGVPSTTSNPSFSLVGNSVTNVQNPTWTGVSGFTVRHYIVACTQQKTAVLTAVSPSTPATQHCRPLYTDNTATVNATNLQTAYASTGNSVFVPYDPTVHGGYIALVSLATNGANTSYGVSTATQTHVDSASLAPAEATTPYTGPIVTPPAAVSFRPGGKAVLPGSNLSGVSKVSVAGLDADVKINSAGELEITVPSSLKPGVYDLVIVSDSGTLTVQDGIRVAAGSSSVGATSEARPSTKLKEDNTVKVWVFDVVGAGKVQIKHNGKEIAWVNTTDSSDSKLTSGYLVRTVDLAPGKNVIEVFVDGVRVDRKAYSN
jgi:hypothetical protein